MSRSSYWNEALETLPWPEVEQWQAQQIEKALGQARAQSGLYAQLFADLPKNLAINSLADLQGLPFTTKALLRDAQDQASAEQPFGSNQAVPSEQILQVICSSGTTGAPMYYPVTTADNETFADAVANTWYTAGVRPGDRVAHLVGLAMVAGGLPYADGFRRLGATLLWLGGFPTERILREMRRLHCTAMLSTTSFGLYLAENWAQVGEETGVASSLQKVLCGGEAGLNQSSIREKMASGLGGAAIREVMGLGDVIPAMWAECEHENGMHFNAQKYVAIELIDPESGQLVPWQEGQTGEMVYTTFARQASPVIRYRSRDHMLVVGTDCPCGRTSPRMRCIGRTDDMLIYKGMNVFPNAIRDEIIEVGGKRVQPLIRVWREEAGQVRFDKPIAVDIEASEGVPASAYNDLKTAVEEHVRHQLQVRVAVTVLKPGSLPHSPYKNALLVTRDA